MGIRINKALGWYIEDVELIRERLQHTISDLKDIHINDQEFKLELNMYPDLDMNSKIENFIEYAEIDGKNYLIFLPPGTKEEWYRYADSIDHYENAIEEDPIAIKKIHTKIFPYYGRMINSKTFKPVPEKHFIIRVMKPEDVNNFSEELKQEFLDMGFDIKKPIENQMHQEAPRSIEIIFEHITEEDVDFRKLKPAILQYWS